MITTHLLIVLWKTLKKSNQTFRLLMLGIKLQLSLAGSYSSFCFFHNLYQRLVLSKTTNPKSERERRKKKKRESEGEKEWRPSHLFHVNLLHVLCQMTRESGIFDNFGLGWGNPPSTSERNATC
ncbi:hypothetical protein CEXT_376361 [Caerostris extrusa]|uniref:Uncharacterized protein n=1 Tax=Caerostris extrusa TaxID=172846 RepID=A0AAV4NGX3_CAEEX|nr:hypothetical protein CEXT_376361 [Caerostris extrusa]